MHNKEEGFILQSYLGQEQRVSVLTRSRGKLKLRIRTPRNLSGFSPGSLISFIIQGDRFLYAEEVEVISVPIVASRRDITWVHHWLELSSYFSQPDLFDEGLFQGLLTYLRLLSRKSLLKQQDTLEIICVFHFLYQTGFYDDDLFMRYYKMIEMVTALSSLPDFYEVLNDLEQFVNKLTINEIKQIEFFILQALQKHPFFRLFKTVRFVYPIQTLRNHDGS